MADSESAPKFAPFIGMVRPPAPTNPPKMGVDM
jgi:hypothetical protein